MFKLKLEFFKWHEAVRCYLFSKVKYRPTLYTEIYYDVMRTFAFEHDDVYKLYMREAPDGLPSLKSMIDEYNSNNGFNNVDYIQIYGFMYHYLNDKFRWNDNITVIRKEKDELYWIEIKNN